MLKHFFIYFMRSLLESIKTYQYSYVDFDLLQIYKYWKFALDSWSYAVLLECQVLVYIWSVWDEKLLEAMMKQWYWCQIFFSRFSLVILKKQPKLGSLYFLFSTRNFFFFIDKKCVNCSCNFFPVRSRSLGYFLLWFKIFK